MPWHRFLNMIYAWCVKHIDPEKREEWEFMLTSPLPGRERQVTERDIEDEGAAFMALMAQQGSM